MPIHHAVLALLAEGGSHGYELKAQFEQSVGPQWGELNVGHLYQVLERLVRDGMVTRHSVSQNDRPDKVVYTMTATGEEELERWLEEPFVRQNGYRDDFFLKLVAAARLGGNPLRKVLRVQREAYLTELAALQQLQRSHKSQPLVALLIEAAVRHTQANLQIVDRASELRTEIVAHERAAAAAARRTARRETDAPASAKRRG
jgi:DNA-binding PadR family transcriptional regulator